jgi:hypothetical protein
MQKSKEDFSIIRLSLLEKTTTLKTTMMAIKEKTYIEGEKKKKNGLIISHSFFFVVLKVKPKR